MRPIATDGVAWSVCVSVCLSVVGRVFEPCKNSKTDRDAVCWGWRMWVYGSVEPCIR